MLLRGGLTLPLQEGIRDFVALGIDDSQVSEARLRSCVNLSVQSNPDVAGPFPLDCLDRLRELPVCESEVCQAG